MYFCNTELVSVDRKSLTEETKKTVKLCGYSETLSLTRLKSMDAMFTQFYKLLKQNNRIINSSAAFFNQDLDLLKNKLVQDTGVKPNRLIYSSPYCYDIIWNGRPPSKFYEHKTLINAESSNEFVVCSYSAICSIGVVITYDVKRDEWVLKEPEYAETEYKKSHYNYYYGIKFS